MYQFLIDDKIVEEAIDCKNILLQINMILSDIESTDTVEWIYDYPRQFIFEFSLNKQKYSLKCNSEQLLVLNLKYLPYFLIHKDHLFKIDPKDVSDLEKNRPEILLDFILCKNALLNPYLVLKYIFHIVDSVFYQLFILYLNLTLDKTDSVTTVNFTGIMYDFNLPVKFKNYEYLFKYYLTSKKMYPFKLNYSKYISRFNTINNN